MQRITRLLTPNIEYHLYVRQEPGRAYVYRLGNRLSVDYAGAYPLQGKFTLIENETNGTVSLDGVAVANVEDRSILVQMRGKTKSGSKEAMEFELFINKQSVATLKSGSHNCEFGVFLRSVKTGQFVRIALDGFLVADAKNCEQALEFGFEKSESLLYRIRELVPDGWYRMRWADEYGNVSTHSFDVKIVCSSKNQSACISLATWEHGQLQFLSEDGDLSCQTLKDELIPLEFGAAYDAKCVFEMIVDETMKPPVGGHKGSENIGVGLLLHSQSMDHHVGGDYVSGGSESLYRSKRMDASKFFFQPIEHPEMEEVAELELKSDIEDEDEEEYVSENSKYDEPELNCIYA